MKIGIIGSGTAGLLTVSSLLSSIKNADIYLLYDPNIDIIGVGESTLLGFPNNLYNSIGFNVDQHFHNLRCTFKHQVTFTNWKKEDFYSRFPAGNYGIHFNNRELRQFLLPIFSKEYPKRFFVKHGNVSKFTSKDSHVEVILDNDVYVFDYLIDCRGFSENYDDACFVDNIYVNSAIVCSSKKPGNWQFTYHYAHQYGWMFGIPLMDKQNWGYLYDNRFISKEEALDNMKDIFKNPRNIDNVVSYHDIDFDNHMDYTFKSFYRKKLITENKNIIKNGNSLFFFEPLQATSMECFEIVNDLIVSYIEGYGNKNEINNSYLSLMEEVIHFINYHYQNGSVYDSYYWKSCKEKSKNFIENHNLTKIINSGKSPWRFVDEKLSQYLRKELA